MKHPLIYSSVTKSFLLLFLISFIGLSFTSCHDNDEDEINDIGKGQESYGFTITVDAKEKSYSELIDDGVYATYLGYDYPLIDCVTAHNTYNEIVEATGGKPWEYKFTDKDLWQFMPEGIPFWADFTGFSSHADFLAFGNLPLDFETHTLTIHWNDGVPDDVLTLTRRHDKNGKIEYIKTINGHPISTSNFEIVK